MLLNFYLIILSSFLSFPSSDPKPVKPVTVNADIDSTLLKRIKLRVMTRFDSWLAKGEFEKTDSFQYRMKQRAPIEFQEICFNEIWKACNWNDRDFSLVLKEYNADREYFNVDAKYRELQWKDSLFIPLSQAKAYRDSFSMARIKVPVGAVAVYNKTFYPKYVFAVDERVKLRDIFILPVNKFSDISISTNDLVLLNPLDQTFHFSLIDFQAEFRGMYDTSPEFPGGNNEFGKFIGKELNQGILASASLHGRVEIPVRFVVDRDGSVVNAKVDKDLGRYGVEAEIIRTLEKSPKWKPAVANDRVVRGMVRRTIPIVFP